MSMQEKKEKAMRIFEALSSVDEDLLVRADEQQTKVVPFRHATRVMAACACLLVVGLVSWTGSRSLMTKESAASDCAAPESVNQMMADTTADKAADAEADVEVGMDEVYNDAYDSDEVVAEEVMEEAAPEIPAAGVEAEVEAESGNMEVWDEESMDGVSSSVKDDAVVYLNEQELRAETVLGEYIPTVIPEGYAFESGYKSADGAITLRWSMGMDDIVIGVALYEPSEENEGRIVDIAKRETYDVHVYEIPYADTVPAEYWEVFHTPIFREKDFGIELVEARMKSVEDLGDTATPRGNFSVLYEEGVIVRFDGDCDAESVWKMFESIGE